MNWQQMLPGKLKTQLKPQVIAGMVLLTLAFSVVIGSQSWARNKIRSDYETKLFNAALGFTLYFEGGFSDHPSDVGGRTYRGITQAEYNVYRSNRGLPGLDVSQMSETELIEIYNI